MICGLHGVVVQSLSCVRLFATSRTVAHQAPLSSTISQSLLKFMSIESLMPSTISSCVVPFSSYLVFFPASGSFPMSQFFSSGGQSIGVSASVLSMNIQDWFPLGCTGLISLQSKEPSRFFSNESVLHIKWPKYWSFNFRISPSNEYSGLISFRIDCFDLLAVQGTLKSLLQHDSLKASILLSSAFLKVSTLVQPIHSFWSYL